MPMLLEDKRIFAVEDNLQNRIVFQHTLIRHGANVTFERWGEQTKFRLQSDPEYDLIILDLMLAAGISGFDIYDEIRQLPSLRHIPIVAVSAMDVAVAVPKARSRGFSSFIAKPIDSHLFPKQLAIIFHGEQVWEISSSWHQPTQTQ